MKIAIISDIHDQIENLNWALDQMKQNNISHMFALGDFTSPYIIERLQVDNIPVHAVWGNCDGARQAMFQASLNENPNISFSKTEFATIEFKDKKYFITHYPDLAENAAKSLDYDVVFHGHTHYQRNEKIGNIPIINPGKLAMYPNDKVSFAIFNTITNTTEFFIK
ncbi:MAG: metallophosphoesterase [Patescibacteria group bacterium]|nr:metallophosphoesterase [Patescibacteria group bacterium]